MTTHALARTARTARFTALAVLAMSLGAAHVGHAQTAPAQTVTPKSPAKGSPSNAPAASIRTDSTTMPKPTQAVPTDYVIGPEDMLQVTVWKNDAMSKQVPVRPDGKISLPLLHDIQA